MTKTREASLSNSSSSSISITALVIIFLSLLSYSYNSCNGSKESGLSALQTGLLAIAGISLISVCLIVVARTTMVAWITVLVLLAFSGKRRRVLVHEGKKITSDIAVNLIMVMFKEKGFFTVICAAAFSLMAMVQVIRM